MMKIFLLIILLSPSLIIFGQNEPHSYVPSDSLKKTMNENIIPPVAVKPDLFIPLSAVNSFSLSLRLGLNPCAPLLANNSGLNTDLLYPSQSLLNEQYKLSFLYSILGAVQTGAIAYMAYQHIKKFGLFK
jgi:hypothetical protein